MENITQPASSLRTVLITAMGCNTSISIAKSLRRSNSQVYRIIGVDMAPLHEMAGSVWCDEYYQVPSYKDDNYIKTLIDIAQKEKADFLMSVMDIEMEKLSANVEVIEKNGIRLCLPEHETIVLCNGKYETNKFLGAKGVRVPATYTPTEFDAVPSKQFPFFIKPRKGVSSVDCYKANNEEELDIFLERTEDPIIQEFIGGEQYVIDVINNLEGKNIVAIPRRELSSKAGIGVKAVTVKDEDLIEYGIKVSELLGIKGAANIEVFKRGGEIILIEVNPRFSAGSIISCVAGVNMPEIVLSIFMGEKIEVESLKWNADIFMTRYWQEVFTDVKKQIKL
ncbi:MAG: ATP-grasp domain-containing protein [Minisyncoccia bacterium]